MRAVAELVRSASGAVGAIDAVGEAVQGCGYGVCAVDRAEDGRGARDVRGAIADKRGELVWVEEARVTAVVEDLDLLVEGAEVLVEGMLELAGEFEFLFGQLLGELKVLADGGAPFFLLGVGLEAAVGFDEFLDALVVLFDFLDQLVVLPVLLGDLVLHEADLLGQVLGVVNPFVEDYGWVKLGGWRHLPDEVDGEVVSGHDDCC